MSHLLVFPLFRKGNAVRFFHFVFFVSGSVSFAFFFWGGGGGSLFEILFWGVGLGLVFFGGFLPMFLFYVLTVRSRN